MDMINTMSSHQCSWHFRVLNLDKGSINKVPSLGYPGPYSPSIGLDFLTVKYLSPRCHQSARKCRPIFSSIVSDSMDPSDPDDIDKKKYQNSEYGGVNNEMLSENLEKIIGMDDCTFSGFDLANLIRNKYGRSYNVQLIKKEFMGKNLLALNVMWKYMEQLTNENTTIKDQLATSESRLARSENTILAMQKQMQEMNDMMRRIPQHLLYNPSCLESQYQVDADKTQDFAHDRNNEYEQLGDDRVEG